MTIEIKQVDHSMSARIMSFLRGTEGNLTVMRSIATPLFEQAANRIAELELERDAHRDRAIKARGQRNKAWMDLKAAEARLAEAVETFEQMRPHVEKIQRCVPINIEMGRVVVGQTDAAKALGSIFDSARFIQETERGDHLKDIRNEG